MARKPPPGKRWLLCAALLVLAGCQEQEQIRYYLAPKESMPKPLGLRRPPFRYTKPNGWEARPADVKKGVPRPVVLRIAEGDREAEVSALALPADGGGVLANVVRWRRQVGLGPVGEAELRKDVRTLKAADIEAPYVDLVGPGPDTPQRILGVMLRHGAETWFLTMKGPADLVGKQQSAFETFVQSIRFDDDQGAAHE